MMPVIRPGSPLPARTARSNHRDQIRRRGRQHRQRSVHQDRQGRPFQCHSHRRQGSGRVCHRQLQDSREYSGGSTRGQNTESAFHQADCVCLRHRRPKWGSLLHGSGRQTGTEGGLLRGSGDCFQQGRFLHAHQGGPVNSQAKPTVRPI